MQAAVGHYRLLDRLGAGGLEVFRARDTRVGRTVAVKLLPPSLVADSDRRAALFETAAQLTRLSHPGIAALFDAGEDGDRVFLACEWVVGETLGSLVGQQPLNIRRALELGSAIADALAEGHAHGLAHADVRPDTIVVSQSGRPKLLDFALSPWTRPGAAGSAGADAAGPAATALAYLSPEQALGQRADHRSDIFSLGLVIFEMLTGTSPFMAPSGADTMVRVLQHRAPPPSRLAPHVPIELDDVVLRALQKSVDARYDSAAKLAADLRRVASQLEGRQTPNRAAVKPGSAGAPRTRSWWKWF
jgi:serine/threonine-protein kinase